MRLASRGKTARRSRKPSGASGGGRDGLKAGAGPPAGGGRGRPGRLQGRLLHHEAGGRAPGRPHHARPPASATSSRAACAAAPIVDMDEAAGRHRPGGRAGRDHGRRQRPGVTVATAGGQLASQPRRRPGLAGRAADQRRRPARAPSARRWPRPAPARPPRHPPAADRLVGGRPAAACAIRAPCSAASSAWSCWWSPSDEQVFQTLGHCVERAHLQFEGVVAAPFASALAALEDDEMDLGCICIDMGGGSTSVAVFAGGSPGARRQPGGGRRPRDRRHRPRPFDLHRRRRADQDPARLGHRLGQRGPRDDRGAAARRRSRRRPGGRAALAAEGHHRPARRGDAGAAARAAEGRPARRSSRAPAWC